MGDLRLQASGFFYARTLYGQQTSWIVMRHRVIEGKFVAMDESSIMESLELHLNPITRMKIWLADEINLESFPSVSDIVQVALFWAAQRLLFTIEELLRISVKGWSEVDEQYAKGLLMWQIGWNTLPQEIGRMLVEFIFIK